MESADHATQVTWAILIMSYLTPSRSHASLHTSDEEFDEEFDAEFDRSSLDTETAEILNRPTDPDRARFLDCIAQLLSPNKGWDYVCATAMRENEDCVTINVARNDSFGIASSEPGNAQLPSFNTCEAEYCGHLVEYLSMTEKGSVPSPRHYNNNLTSTG